jgi:hypothetical protein
MKHNLKKIQGFIIDPTTSSVKELNLENAGLEIMYDLLECSMVEAVGLPNGDVLWLDEESLLCNPEHIKAGFFLYTMKQYFVGKGLILGCTINGDNCSAKTTREDIDKLGLHFGSVITSQKWQEYTLQNGFTITPM